RGVPQIEVTFDIDANGILNVSAKDKGTGKEQKIRIEAGSGLTKEEIEKMKAEAKANEATDKEARERIEKLNAADGLVFQTEKQLKEFGDKIPAEKKAVIEQALEKLKEVHKLQDINAIEDATKALNEAWTAASQDMYNATQGAGQTGAQGADSSSSNGQAGAENVTDAEFEEVK
ncbi:MAG: molecular chaperone DnaK, partial [Bacteroidota bacterium]